MPEPISTVILTGVAILCPLKRNSSISSEGRYLKTNADSLYAYITEPITQDTKRYEAIALLKELQEEHSQDGWDGEEAVALSQAIVVKACNVLERLPTDIPDPEFIVEPDGSLGFEWQGGHKKEVVLSFGMSERFAFSSVDDTDFNYGVYSLKQGLLPEKVINEIRDVIS